MAINEKKITFRCDDTLDKQLDEILEYEISKAKRNNQIVPRLADVIRMAIKEKYARDVTGEEKDIYMEMMKTQFEHVVGAAFSDIKLTIIKCHEKDLTQMEYMYNVLTKYNDITMLTSGFKADDEKSFRKAIDMQCVFKELIEEQLMENRIKENLPSSTKTGCQNKQ